MYVHLNNKTTLNLKTIPVIAVYQTQTTSASQPSPRFTSPFYVSIGSNDVLFKEDAEGKKDKIVVNVFPLSAEDHTRLRDGIEKYMGDGGNYYKLAGNVYINRDLVSAVQLFDGKLKVHYPGGVWTSRSDPKAGENFDRYIQYINQEGATQLLNELTPPSRPPAKPPPDTAEREKAHAEQDAKFQEMLARCAIIDMVEEARRGHYPPFGGRERKLEEIEDILLRKRKNNPMVLGDSGTGKTALIQQLAVRIARKQVPPELWDARLYALNLNAMDVTKYKGEFEGNFFPVFNRFKRLNRDGEMNIVFFDEAQIQFQAGKAENTPAASNLAKNYLEDPLFRSIGATTLSEFDKLLASDKAFERRWAVVRVQKPDRQEVLEMLEPLRIELKEEFNIHAPRAMMGLVHDMSEDLLPNRNQPDKSVELFDAGAMAAKKEKSPVMTERHVLQSLETMFNLRPGFLQESERERYMTLDAALSRKVFGQEGPLREIADALKAGRARLTEAHRPIGTLLFVGPDSTGRTTTARAIAGHLAGGEENMVHFDMKGYTEFQGARRRLLGTGSRGGGAWEEGELTGALERKPFSVLFFDGIDAADAKVRDMIRDIADSGIAADLSGKKHTLRNAIVIMTAKDHQHTESLRDVATLVEFGPLPQAAHEKIMRREIISLSERLEAEWGAALEVPPRIVSDFAAQAARRQWSAKRAATEFKKELVLPLGGWLIENMALRTRFASAAAPEASNNNDKPLLKVAGIGGSFRIEKSGVAAAPDNGVVRLLSRKPKAPGDPRI